MKDKYGFSDSAIDIIRKKDVVLNRADKKFLKDFDAIESIIFKELKKYTSQFNKEGGQFVYDDTNIDLMNQIDAAITSAFKTSGYNTRVSDYLQDYNVLKKFNGEIHKDVNSITSAEFDKLINPVQKAMVNKTISDLTGTGVDAAFTRVVKDGIFKNIVSGATEADLVRDLNTWILSDPAKLSLLQRYTGQVARDALHQYDGQINASVAAEFGLNAFRYVGSLIDDSRPQCIRWVGKEVILKEDLEAELIWAQNNGSGLIAGTNAATFAVYRGGYSCRHTAVPFKLTKSQLAELKGVSAEVEVAAASKSEVKAKAQVKEVKAKIEKKVVANTAAEKKRELIPNQFVSNQAEKLNQDYREILKFADGALEICNERGVNVFLQTAAESGSSRKREAFGAPFGLKYWQVPEMGVDTNGVCARSLNYVSVKVKAKQRFEFKSYDKITAQNTEAEILQNYPGSRIKTVRDHGRCIFDSKGVGLGRIEGNGKVKYFNITFPMEADLNLAGTASHEFGHVIHWAKDIMDPRARNPIPEKMFSIAKDLKVKLEDSPSIYGETNWREFFSESFAAYTYSPSYFKAEFPKAYELFVKTLDALGVTRQSVIQAP